MQEVFIYILVAVAVVFFVKRIYDQIRHKKKPGCAECGSGKNVESGLTGFKD